MATDVVDAVITELKKAAIFSSRVYRGWPPVTTLMPLCGVGITHEADIVYGDGHGLQMFGRSITVNTWAKDRLGDCRTAVRSAVYGLVSTKHWRIYQGESVDIDEGNGVTHIVTTFNITGGS